MIIRLKPIHVVVACLEDALGECEHSVLVGKSRDVLQPYELSGNREWALSGRGASQIRIKMICYGIQLVFQKETKHIVRER